ncbi:MAG: DUF1304 domain-containing protein [Paracoccaceae bacterium]
MIAFVLVALVAAIHVWILVMEVGLWETPRVRAIFGTSAEFARASRMLAANQGLYNGFLAAGLIFALVLGLGGAGYAVALFFLACILVAGGFGGVMVSSRILWVQAGPAAVAMMAVVWH